MAKGERILSNLLGRGIEFDTMPNEELSGKRAVIHSIRMKDGELVYTVELLDTGRLVDWQGNRHFKLLA